MFDIGFWEILLIGVLALVVLGPERLPKAAKTVGYWVGKGRRYIEGVKQEVASEFDASELKRLLHNQEVQLKELQSKIDVSQNEINENYTNVLDDEKDPVVHHEPQYEIIEEDDSEEIKNTPSSKSADKSKNKPEQIDAAEKSE